MSEYTDALRALADHIDTATGHQFTPSEAFSELRVYVDTKEQLGSVARLIASAGTIVTDPARDYTDFPITFGPFTFHVAVRNSLAVTV